MLWQTTTAKRPCFISNEFARDIGRTRFETGQKKNNTSAHNITSPRDSRHDSPAPFLYEFGTFRGDDLGGGTDIFRIFVARVYPYVYTRRRRPPLRPLCRRIPIPARSIQRCNIMMYYAAAV